MSQLLIRAALCAPLAMLSLLPAPAAAQSDQDLIALTTSSRLVRFSTVDTCATDPAVKIAGLAPSEVLLGIDIRPATGELYGLGSSSRLYRPGHRSGHGALRHAVCHPALGQRLWLRLQPGC